MVYANKTTVSTEKSRAEIERVQRRYGASAFGYQWMDNRAFISFELQSQRVRFMLLLPDKADKRFTHSSRGPRSPERAHAEWEQGCRASWRALLLVLRAKLEAVVAGITTIEDEFLPHVVLPSGETVAEWLKPQLAVTYQRKEMPPQLEAPADAA
jgi:hypothetical protein